MGFTCRNRPLNLAVSLHNGVRAPVTLLLKITRNELVRRWGRKTLQGKRYETPKTGKTVHKLRAGNARATV